MRRSKYTAEFRSAVLEFHEDGHSVTETARAFGVSPGFIYAMKDPKRNENQKEYYRKVLAPKQATRLDQLNLCRTTALRKGINFELTLEEYKALVNMGCYYCNEILPTRRSSYFLDRIDNNKSIGYRPGNLLPCCTECNMLRGERLSVEETKAAVQAVVKLRKAQSTT